MTSTHYQAKVVPRASPDAGGVWVCLPDDFETGRVKSKDKSQTAFSRASALFDGHEVVAFRRALDGTAQPDQQADYKSVEEWRRR